MSLINSITNVAKECGYVVDSAAFGSTDPTTVQLLAMAQRIIREMGKAYPWTKLYASGSITLAAGTASYALPAAFSYYHYETFWNKSTRWRVLGPMTPQEYGAYVGYGLNTSVYKHFQIRNNPSQILFFPTPAAGDDGQIIIFEFISNRYARPQTWLSGTVFSANAYCFNNGNYYQTSSGGSGGSAPVHTTGTVGLWTYYDGAYDQFLADTDEPIFDAEVFEQGVIERFAEPHGLTGISPKFQIQLNEEYSRERPGQVLYAGGDPTGRVLSARSGTVVFGSRL